MSTTRPFAASTASSNMTDRLSALALVAHALAPLAPLAPLSKPSITPEEAPTPTPRLSYHESQKRRRMLRDAKKPIPLIRKKREFVRVILKHKYGGCKPKLNPVGDRPPTIGDLCLEIRRYPNLNIRIAGYNLFLCRDSLSKFSVGPDGKIQDIEYDKPLLLKLFGICYPKQGPSNVSMTDDEIAILSTYGLPEVDALLNPSSYLTFRRLILAHCTYIPLHYRLFAKRYLLEAIDMIHITVVELAHHRGFRICLNVNVRSLNELYLKTMEWVIRAGLLELYCETPVPDHELQFGPQDVPAIVKLIFIHDRDELLELILKKYCHKTNRDTINYALAHNAHKCLEVLSHYQ